MVVLIMTLGKNSREEIKKKKSRKGDMIYDVYGFSRNSNFSRFASETRLRSYLNFRKIIQKKTSLFSKFE